jgi:hypothetical protein
VEVEIRIKALAKHLNIDPEEIEESKWDEKLLVVSPHKVKDGTSPAKAKELVALLRKGLDLIPSVRDEHGVLLHEEGGAWTTERVRTLGYRTIENLLRTWCPPELFKVGIHDLVNTLYFLCPETDAETHAKDHRDTLREAFEGKEPTDRRTERQTDNGEYLVVEDDEADELWDQELESYLDDPGIVPGADSRYFDREKWKDDAKVDGRESTLARYDGCEYEETVEDEFDGEVTLYIYRQN